MPVTMARIDQKLIHGQVTAAWVPYLRIQEIVVVDDLVIEDPVTQAILSSGVPSAVQTAFASETGAAELLSESERQSLRLLLIFGSVAAAGRAVAAGLSLDSLNLGNLAYFPAGDCVKLSDCFYAKPKDLATLTFLYQKGLKIYLQSVPGDPPRPFNPPGASAHPNGGPSRGKSGAAKGPK
ncbi:MAG: PTS sugar transporter subunit IIB [Deltaproteobacteria bacterium]|jgi:PTS system mannose-specific IIB component|nr:PTS sugar transporter subunit IIB [Deltaproteobacteria bacterium]